MHIMDLEAIYMKVIGKCLQAKLHSDMSPVI